MISQSDQQLSRSPQLRQSAKALLTAANRILLVKETHSDGSEFWTLPGGGVEHGESHKMALSRELMEELRCPVDIGKQMQTLWYSHTGPSRTVSRWHVFRCWAKSQLTPCKREGILDSRWVRWTDLPANTLAQVRHLLQTLEPEPPISSPSQGLRTDPR